MPNISYVRPELAVLLGQYRKIRDCIAGSEAVKAAREWYLPKPDKLNRSPENDARYADYVERAVFYNVTSKTVQSFVGGVFAEDPLMELPALLAPLETDANGAGVGLFALAKMADELVVAYGRAGVWVDYPDTGGTPTTRAQLQKGDIHPLIHVYSPGSCINWRVATFGAKKKLTLVVIEDLYLVHDDGFEIKTGPLWKVLRLEDGVYTVKEWVQEYDDRGQATDQYRLYRQYTPQDASGKTLDFIPFTFVGAINNDTNLDHPPMGPIAELNIAHYRNSADYEESCFVVGQPTPVISGVDEAWYNNILMGRVNLGSRGGVPLPVGATMELLQADPNIMPMEAMAHKERQMVALGAKLVEDKQTQRTLGEAQMESAAEESVIVTIAHNVSSAFEQALKWCAQFAGAAGTVGFELNTDFQNNNMTSQERAELINEWKSNAISFTEMRHNLRRTGVTTQDDEEAKAEIDEEMQASMDFQNENSLDNPQHPGSPNNPDNLPIPVKK